MFPPVTFDANDGNKISFAMSTVEEEGQEIANRLVTIDTHLRDNIALTAAVATRLLEIVTELQDPSKRDFQLAKTRLTSEIKKIFDENIAAYRATLAEQSSYMENGREIQLTDQKKEELLTEYRVLLTRNLDTLKGEDLTEKTDLNDLKTKLEEKIRLNDLLAKQQQNVSNIFTKKLYETLQDLQRLARMRTAVLVPPPTNMFRACELGAIEYIKDQIIKNRSWLGLGNAADFLNKRDDTKLLNGEKYKVFTALDYAAYRADDRDVMSSDKLPTPAVKLEVVKLLLKEEADPTIRSDLKYQALHWAAKCGDVDIAAELLKNKKVLNEINSAGDCGRTPLHMAVYNKRRLMVEFLLKMGADINAKADVYEGCITPFFYVVEQAEMMEMATVLLSNNKIALNEKNSRGRTPLSIAVERGNVLLATLIRTHQNWKLPKEISHPDRGEELVKLLPLVPSGHYDEMRRFLVDSFNLDITRVIIPPKRVDRPLKKSPSPAGITQDEDAPRTDLVAIIPKTSVIDEFRILFEKIGNDIKPISIEEFNQLQLELALLLSKLEIKDSALYLNQLSRLEGRCNVTSRVSLPGNRLFGTYNQFSKEKRDNSPWSKDASNASCAVNVLQFFSSLRTIPTFMALAQQIADPKTNFINIILDEARTYFESLCQIRRDEAEKLVQQVKAVDGKEAAKVLKWQVVGDSLNVGDIDQQKFLLKTHKSSYPTKNVIPDNNSESTVAFFTEILRGFKTVLEENKIQTLYVALTCNGYTYGVALLVNPQSKVEYAVFDSHGNRALNDENHAFIYWTENINEAGAFLGHLIKFSKLDLKDFNNNKEVVKKVSEGLNELAIYSFIPS